MKIDLYSNMHNEALIIPYWLRHYEPLVDRIFVWDDESTDKTVELLTQCPKVTILPEKVKGNWDAYWVKELFPLYEKYSMGKADWVIVADGDEFIYHPSFREVMQAELDVGTDVIECTGFAMIANEFPTPNDYPGKQLIELVKFGLPDGLESKWTIHTANKSIRFAKGRHGPVHNRRAFVRNRNTGIKLFHYRYFGDGYYANRDIVTIARNELVFHQGKVYTPDWANTLPDGTHGAALAWFNEHKKEAKNVVDFE